MKELADEFAATGSNSILRAYAYTGFDPLVKDSEGWAAAIARFNPTNKDDDSSDSESGPLPDPYTEEYRQEVRREVCRFYFLMGGMRGRRSSHTTHI